MNLPDNIRFEDGPTGYGSSDFRVRAPIVGAGGMRYLAFMSIGEGGMARVYLAKARGPGGFEKLVVLKTIRRHALKNPNVRKLFVDEARLCAQLNHPNLVQVYDVDLNAEAPCLVMEYLEGKSLNEILQVEALSQVMLLAVCSEVLAGLAYAHELRGLDGELMNVVHRDVSPHNLFVTYDGAAKVLDFGIAKMAGAVSDTATEEVKGKLTYMAPEQLMGSDVDGRVDVFAMGVILWEIAVGRRMWDGVTQPVMMNCLATGQIPQVPEDAGVDPALAAIIAKATAADADQRYPSALTLRADLDDYLHTRGRRPSMREIGEVLADVFSAEREKTAAAIRAALEQRESMSPPPFEEEVPAPKEPSRRGLLVLSLSIVLVACALVFALLSGRRSSEPVQSGVQEALIAPEPGESPPSVASEPSAPRTIDLDEKKAARQEDEPSSDSGAQVEEDLSEDDAPAATEKPKAPVGKRPKAYRPRVTPPPVSANAETAAPISPAAPAPAPRENSINCNPPYYYKDGIKTYRPECL